MIDRIDAKVEWLRHRLAVKRPSVAVIGDFCLDAYWHLDRDAEEVSGETGLPVRRVSSQAYSLGGAGNVVANLVALGVTDVRSVGIHGGDPFGRTMLELLADLGADLTGMVDMGPRWETLTYAKPHAGRDELERFDFGTRSELPAASVEALLQRVAEAVEWADAVIINQQILGCFVLPAITSAVNDIIADHPDTLSIVDARDSATQFRGAILKLNAAEAAKLVDPTAAEGVSPFDIKVVAQRIMERTGCRSVFVTRGERGILAVDATGIHEAPGIEILGETDPVGAGDTVSAAIAAVLASGGDSRTAADIANLAASVTVRKLRTTGTATLDELGDAADRRDLVYSPDLADSPASARVLPGTEFELIAELPVRPRYLHAIFDHDGTLSTLRQGWEDIMEPMMIRAILGSSHGNVEPGTYQSVQASVRDFIDRSTGLQTLVQMQGLADLVRRYGFVPGNSVLDEHAYKAIYNEDLLDLVRTRRSKLSTGQLTPEDLHMKGAIPMLRRLREKGIMLHLASGTDQAEVVEEAHALGFGEFFGERIHGAVGDVKIEAKRVVLERLVRDDRLEAGQLVTFGDGPVEMQVTRRHHGVAVGVCSDERRRYGFNPAKRSRLIRGGAMLLIPDFSDLEAIMRVLDLGGSSSPRPGLSA